MQRNDFLDFPEFLELRFQKSKNHTFHKMSFKVNDRVRDKKGECRGTVKYVGKVATSTKNPDFIWIGVQWDDPKRGKHGGRRRRALLPRRIPRFLREPTN